MGGGCTAVRGGRPIHASEPASVVRLVRCRAQLRQANIRPCGWPTLFRAMDNAFCIVSHVGLCSHTCIRRHGAARSLICSACLFSFAGIVVVITMLLIVLVTCWWAAATRLTTSTLISYATCCSFPLTLLFYAAYATVLGTCLLLLREVDNYFE